MKLVTKRNRWECQIASLAMLLDKSIDELATLIGHDGSEIIFPDLPEPLGRKAHHTQELIDVALVNGIALVEITVDCPQSPDGIHVYNYPLDPEVRITAYMNRYDGLISGQYAPGKWHCCAWEHTEQKVYDPDGKVYTFESNSDHITIASFFAAIGINEWKKRKS